MPIALAVKRCEYGKDKFLAQTIGNEIKDLTTFTFEELTGSEIQEGGALGVARKLGVEDLVCLMHDNNKLGESGVGNLVRTKKKKAIGWLLEIRPNLRSRVQCDGRLARHTLRLPAPLLNKVWRHDDDGRV